MATRNGVEYDLTRSPYKVLWRGYLFAFSSFMHEQKFRRQVEDRCAWLTDSLSRRFHFRVDADVIAAFQLYVQTETRGFYVQDADGKAHRCQETIELAGLKLRESASTARRDATTTLLEEQPGHTL